MNLIRPEPPTGPRRRSTDLPLPPVTARGAAPAQGSQPVFRFDIERSMQMHRKLAMGIALGGLVLAVLLMAFMHPGYTAQALIYVQPATPRVMDQNGAPARWPNDPNEYESYIQHQVSTVTRHDVLANTLTRLAGDPWMSDGKRGESEPEALERLGKALTVERVGGTYQIAVNASARTAASAAHLANASAESYIEFAHREEKSGDTERLTMLRDERERIVSELAADRAEQETLNKQLGVAAIGTTTPDPYDEQMGEIRTELVKARTAHDEAAARLTSVNVGKGASSAALDAEADELIATDAGLASMKSSLNQRRAVLISQMANLTVNHPQYKQDAAELAQINTSIENMMKDLRAKAAARIQQRLRTDLEQTSGVESRLNGQLGQLTAQAAGATPKLQRSNDLATDIVRLQGRYTTVDALYRNQMLEDAAPGSVHMAAAAEAPLRTTSSGRTRMALALLLGGVLFGVGAAVTANKLDPKIYIQADVEQVLGFPPMGLLPDFDEVSEGVAEEFMLRLAAAIDHARQQGNLKSCIFTGAASGAGVTTVVTRTRAMLGAIGRSTVLMDASGPQPSISRMNTGARGGAEGDGRSTRPSRPNRSTALLRRMDEESREAASLVLTDTAPLLISAETEYLVRFADAAIVVIQSGATTRVQLRDAAAALERLNVSAVGFVLNRVGMETATPDFRASVRAMEEHLDAQTQPASWRHEAAHPAARDFASDFDEEAAEDTPSVPVAEQASVPAKPGMAAAPKEVAPEAVFTSAQDAPAVIPATVTAATPAPADKERTTSRLPRVPLVEVATYVSTLADPERRSLNADKELVLPRARKAPVSEPPARPAQTPSPETPWWLADPELRPEEVAEDKPQGDAASSAEPTAAGSGAPVVADAAAAPASPSVEARTEKAVSEHVHAVVAPAATEATFALESLPDPATMPAPAPASAGADRIAQPGVRAEVAAAPDAAKPVAAPVLVPVLVMEPRFAKEEPVAVVPVRIWEELAAVHPGTEHRSATEEVLAGEQGDNEHNLATRLSGLKSLFQVLGQKNGAALKNPAPAAQADLPAMISEPVRGAASAQTPETEPAPAMHAGTVVPAAAFDGPLEPRKTVSAPAAPAVAETPVRTVAARPASELPVHVTAAPVILPPSSPGRAQDKEAAKARTRTSSRDEWDDVDEVQILPSWRGQYRRKG